MQKDNHKVKDCSLRKYVWNKKKYKEFTECDVCLYYDTLTCPNKPHYYDSPKFDKFVDIKQ